MLISVVRRIVGLCSHYPWPVISLALGLSVLAGVYAVNHFAITTDINKLIAPELGWRQREIG